MSWWKKLFQKAWTESDEVFARLLGAGPTSKSGVGVGLNSALMVAPVLACSRVMSEDVAAMPFRVVQNGPDGFDAPAYDHPLYRLMDVGPNDWQTGFEFRETAMMHLMLTGNFYAFKNVVRGRLKELIPFLPGQVRVIQDSDYNLTYHVDSLGKSQTFPAEKIWHIRGPSMNAYVGLDIVHQAREAIGLAIATEESHSNLHKNGVRPSGLYSVDGTLNEQDYNRLQAWLEKRYAGLDNSSKPLILDRGGKFVSSTMSGVDAEHLATRQYQIEEICRAMRVIPIMIGYSDKTSTYASAEQMFLAHNNIVGKWCRRIDNSADKALLTPEEYAKGYRMRHQINALLYADTKAKAAWYTALYMIGAINPNEVRGFEHMKPYANGDQFRVPVNMSEPTAQTVTDAVKSMFPDEDADWGAFRDRLEDELRRKG